VNNGLPKRCCFDAIKAFFSKNGSIMAIVAFIIAFLLAFIFICMFRFCFMENDRMVGKVFEIGENGYYYAKE
jgi:hypothetical protein